MDKGDSVEGKGNAVFSMGKERKALGRLFGGRKALPQKKAAGR